jgi:hypothetical protein
MTNAVATRARELGNQLGPKARELKDAVGPKAREIGQAVGPKARELRDAVGPRARELGQAVGPKVKELGEVVGPKVKVARRKVGFWIAGEEPRKPRKWPAIAAAGIGAVAAFFLDPTSGKRRRAATKDWVAARFRAVGRSTTRLGRGVGRESLPENDATLAHKIESELFQGLDIPSGQIDINAENGVVVLRGTLKRPTEIVEVERRVWDVHGVRRVENLLHLEGTPAPTR